MDPVTVTVEDLKKIIALQGLPDHHLQWILDRSEYLEYEDGNTIAKYGETAEWMWFLLCGEIHFYMNVNGQQVYYFTFQNNEITGGVGGLIPYSRMKTYPGFSYAIGQVKVIRINKKYFAELEDLNPEFLQKLIGYMTERAKIFATTQLQHEKVNALGKLAAGIAHELNNPAAAINGIANDLKIRLDKNYELTKNLLQCNLNAQQFHKFHSLTQKKELEQDSRNKISAFQRIEQEDMMDDWLGQNGVSKREIAETFTEFGFTPEELQAILDEMGQEAFILIIPWLENLLSSQKIIKDLSLASGRISNLVGSIKSHVHMDQTNDLQPTDLNQDLSNALTLLGFKLRAKNIEVRKILDQNLPEVPAFIGELNQVWTNLLDNAIFALEKNGVLTITTTFDDQMVTITVMDNGSGIPKEIQSRIFDPFFTTKKVGEGSGLGLDIVSRVIKRHHGKIVLHSEPCKTEFIISIPTKQEEP